MISPRLAEITLEPRAGPHQRAVRPSSITRRVPKDYVSPESIERRERER